MNNYFGGTGVRFLVPDPYSVIKIQPGVEEIIDDLLEDNGLDELLDSLLHQARINPLTTPPLADRLVE